MNYFTTKLAKLLSNNVSVEEFFRSELENAINHLLLSEIDSFLDYEKYSVKGYNSGDSRNGSYTRTLQTRYGTLNIVVPRDRIGAFKQHTLPSYSRSDDFLEKTVIQLYSKGVTTREIADLIEKMYGHYYSPQTVSNITKTVQKQVEEFHNRKVEEHYTAVYCDATYLNIRRDSVAKEALHILIGITESGTKEVIDYALFPSESAENYKEMLLNLKNRGLREVLLFITDGLPGVRESLLESFPKAKHQYCWTHLSRNILKYIRAKDKSAVMQDFKKIHSQKTQNDAITVLMEFCKKYGKIYPKVVERLSDVTGLFTFYEFPESIRSSIYTTNPIENFNKNIKREVKKKIQFPDENSMERFICTLCIDYNKKFQSRIHKGFLAAEVDLNQLFT